MTVDISRIKPGDEVTIRCRAHAPRDGGWTVRAIHEEAASYVLAAHIVSHTPKALSANDKVWGVATKCSGIVRHVIGDLAWVEFEDGRHEVVLPGQVERAA